MERAEHQEGLQSSSPDTFEFPSRRNWLKLPGESGVVSEEMQQQVRRTPGANRPVTPQSPDMFVAYTPTRIQSGLRRRNLILESGSIIQIKNVNIVLKVYLKPITNGLVVIYIFIFYQGNVDNWFWKKVDSQRGERKNLLDDIRGYFNNQHLHYHLSGTYSLSISKYFLYRCPRYKE